MKHFTYDDRLVIQRGLTLGWNFSRIAAEIGKDRTSVSREIRAHLRYDGKKPARSRCIFRHECIFEDRSLCPVPECPKRVCSVVCSMCAQYCDRYEPEICPKLLKPPYVCNGCSDRGGNNCLLQTRLYFADHAQKIYRQTLTDSRAGISLSEDEFRFLTDNIVPLIRNGVSVPVVYDAYADRMPVSIRTLYDYIDKGYFDAGNLDLHRKVRRKSSRQKSGPVLHVDKKCHVGRTYADFLAFMNVYPNYKISEMDTVEGRKGGKVILTIFLRECSLQLMFLRDTKTAAGVSDAFVWLREALDVEFAWIFDVILVDRGTEFTDPTAIEIDHRSGEVLCNVFYCDPQQTNQKSRCERNHEFIRYILPKGSSFDDLTKDDVTLMMNHINSLPRASLNARSPYQVFENKYGKETAAKLGLKYIPLEELCLTPELLKK